MGYNPNTRYQHRSKQRAKKFVRGLLTVFVLVGLGFFVGKEYNKGEASVFRNRVKTIETERDALQQDVVELQAAAQTASVRYDRLKQDYDALSPKGALGDLIALVKEKVEQGMDTDYLTYVVRTAGAPRKCSEPDSKRFVLATPNFKGSNNSVSINEGAITITGMGESAYNANNEPESWFDSTKKVSVTFKPKEGISVTKKRNLPFSHSITLENKEYRFTIDKGAKSFLKVSYDICDYFPGQ